MISNVTVPDDISFEQAIQLTQELLQRWEPGKISEVELEQWMTDLMKTQNGARGFFVTALSDARNIFDPPTPALIKGLKSSPARVGELMTKNLAMSSAMIIHHQRHQDLDLAQGSENVRSRSQQLIQALNLPVL
ncbi:MAG: hypothetical protein HC825_05270, partial [Oscillatoriales cyanobacterium RM1_1_9]|nr:hypothetical protein [Oscillatoriales cyanobacterium RM1_1_9]